MEESNKKSKLQMVILFFIMLAIVGSVFFMFGCKEAIIEEKVDLSKIPVKEMSIYKGVSTTIPKIPLKMGYVGIKNSEYLLKVEHTGDKSCEINEIPLSKEKPSYYICQSEKYVFDLNPSKSNQDTITFSVKSVGETPPAEEKTIEKKECIVSQDCGKGFHCLNRGCVSNDIFKSFKPCEDKVCQDGICNYSVCLQDCGNCKTEKMLCMLSSMALNSRLCVECFMDTQCKTGYVCKEYKCVSEKSQQNLNTPQIK